jgi:hypothetical protein
MGERFSGIAYAFSNRVPPEAGGSPAESMEYYVAAIHSPEALELEEKLNDAGRNGWTLFQIIPEKEDLLLVFYRQSRSSAKSAA